jgi:hypothetical protein
LMQGVARVFAARLELATLRFAASRTTPDHR